MDKFDNIDKIAHKATPLALSVVTDTCPPIGIINLSFHNKNLQPEQDIFWSWWYYGYESAK